MVIFGTNRGVAELKRLLKWSRCWNRLTLPMLVMFLCMATESPKVVLAQDGPVERFGEIVPVGRYALRWGMQKGQKFLVEAVQETVTEIESPLGKSGKMPASLTVNQEWEVIESDDTSLTLVQTFRRLTMETIIPGAGKFNVDTNGPEPESIIAKQMHANLSELVGRQLRLQMDRLGNVKKFEFVELPAGDTPAATNQFLTKENLKNVVGQMVQFPKTTRAIGETWGITTKAPQPNGSAEVNTEFTLVETLADQPRWIKINVAPKLTLSVKDDAVTVDRQSSEGYLVYDDVLAVVRETYLKQTLTFGFKADGGGQRTIESTMRMKIEPQPNADAAAAESPIESDNSGPVNLETGKSDK